MNTICTIITSNYLQYATTLYRSLTKFNATETLNILICDEGAIDQNLIRNQNGIHIYRIGDLYRYGSTDIIYNKYSNTNMDALRWSMKPVFISYLLENGHSNVMYCDCDLFFFDDYSFIYKEMNSAGLLLTPHWTTPYPAVHEEEFLSLFNYGAYNAGFLCASKKGLPALKWWADVCAYRIEESHCNGLHNDQKYLDALPVFFKDIKILDHKGCNIAFWNQHVCKRMLINNKVLINGEFPIVFIHFTNKYIPELLNGNDALIYPYFLEYEKSFRLSGSSLNEFIPDMPTYKPPQPFIKIKRKLLVRTRIKRWLFKLSQR